MDPSAPTSTHPRHPIAPRLAAHPLVAPLVPLAGDLDVYVVGGMVRDALLGRPHLDDVDLVVEGDAVALARRLGHEMGVRVVAHERFGTAVLELPHGGHVDLITARRESYARPGALPDVRPGDLADDLGRRDFAINAMAVGVAGRHAGLLVDPWDGVGDLARRRVRALRPGAFPEDPSRVVRAARYAGRLGFTLDDTTEAEARETAAELDWTSARVGEELRRLLAERDPAPAVRVLRGLGAPGLRPDAADRLARVDAAAGDPAAPRLPRWALLLGAALTPPAAADVALPGWARALAAEVAAGDALAERLADEEHPSGRDARLGGSPPATQVGALAAGATAVRDWWTRDRDRRVDVTGADLVRAGIAPGPAIGRALRAVRAAVLDGEVAGRDAQLALALAVARGER